MKGFLRGAFSGVTLSSGQWRSALARAWPYLVTFALTFGSGVLGLVLPKLGGQLPLLILPSGVAVAALFRAGRGQWPAVLLAGSAIGAVTQDPWLACLGVGVGLCTGSWLVITLLLRGRFDASFARSRDVSLFIVAASLGMLLAPMFGFLGFALSGRSAGAGDPVRWLSWWSTTTVGVLMIVPLLIGASARSLVALRARWPHAILWGLGVAACCAAMLFAPDPQIVRPPLLVLAVLLTTIGSIGFGLVVAAFGTLAISLTGAVCMVFGWGAFSNLTPLQGLVTIWSLAGVLTGLNLIITALLAERDAATQAKLRADRRYAQIFDGSPAPIWVHEPRSRRFLMVNEATCRQYGWTREELLERKVDVLLPRGAGDAADRAMLQGTGGDWGEPLETAHVTRDGRRLEVELWARVIDIGGEPAMLVFANDVTERRAFGEALVEAVAGEQRRIGQEMHDGLGQELTGLALSARALANRAARERDAIAPDLEELAALASSCIQESRAIVQGLSPLTETDGSLESALEALARRASLSGTPVRFEARPSQAPPLDLKTRNHLYRIAQEAVQNALKHAHARAIDIRLESREDVLRLEVLDDGRGTPAAGSTTGLGMRTMRLRASAIGARLSIAPRAGGGQSIVCDLPRGRVWPEVAHSR